MQELFPVLAGALVGVAALSIAARRWRVVAIVAASAVIGLVASAVSGELAANWAFLLVDTAQVLVAALLMLAAATLWQRRRATLR
jgi:MYXO-CTERM domain-containing protein